MLGLLFAVVITATVTPDADVEYLGALLYGETCGMPVEAQSLVAENYHAADIREWVWGRVESIRAECKRLGDEVMG